MLLALIDWFEKFAAVSNGILQALIDGLIDLKNLLQYFIVFYMRWLFDLVNEGGKFNWIFDSFISQWNQSFNRPLTHMTSAVAIHVHGKCRMIDWLSLKKPSWPQWVLIFLKQFFFLWYTSRSYVLANFQKKILSENIERRKPAELEIDLFVPVQYDG